MKKKIFITLCVSVLPLSGCGLTVPNIKVCKVAGGIVAGADCIPIQAQNMSEMSQLTVGELIDFIEPRIAQPDPKDPKKIIPGHGAAILISAADWNRFETALEIACQKIGCNFEVTKAIATVKTNVNALGVN